MLLDAMREFLVRILRGICEPFVWFGEHLGAFQHRYLPTDTVDGETDTVDGEVEVERPRKVWEYFRHWILIFDQMICCKFVMLFTLLCWMMLA